MLHSLQRAAQLLPAQQRCLPELTTHTLTDRCREERHLCLAGPTSGHKAVQPLLQALSQQLQRARMHHNVVIQAQHPSVVLAGCLHLFHQHCHKACSVVDVMAAHLDAGQQVLYLLAAGGGLGRCAAPQVDRRLLSCSHGLQPGQSWVSCVTAGSNVLHRSACGQRVCPAQLAYCNRQHSSSASTVAHRKLCTPHVLAAVAQALDGEHNSDASWLCCLQHWQLERTPSK